MLNVGDEVMMIDEKHHAYNPECYPAIHSPDFKALVPICDYLKHEGVNV